MRDSSWRTSSAKTGTALCRNKLSNDSFVRQRPTAWSAVAVESDPLSRILKALFFFKISLDPSSKKGYSFCWLNTLFFEVTAVKHSTAAPRKTRTIDPEDKAQRVLSTARHLFVLKGYHRVTIPDIVEASGVSTGAIYNLFRNKENLARILHNKTLDDFQTEFEGRLIRCRSTYEKLRAFAELVFDLTEKDPSMMEYMMFMKHVEFMDGAAPVCLTEPFRLIREIVTEGMKKGEIKQGDYFACAVSFTGAILRPAQLHLQCVLPKPLSEMSEEFIANAWAAVKA